MSDSKKNTNFTGELRLIWKNRMLLLVAGCVPAIAVFITTYFVEPTYQSTAIVYPAGFDTQDKMQIKQGNTLLILQLLESTYLRDTIIKQFNLVSHYGIDTSTSNWTSELHDIFRKNIQYERTVLKSIEIDVRDKHPLFAAQLANGVAASINIIHNSMAKQHKKPVLENARKNYENKLTHVDRLSEEFGAYKVAKSQEHLDQLHHLLEAKQAKISLLQDSLGIIREMTAVQGLSEHLDILQKEYIDTKSKYVMEQRMYQVYREKFSEKDSASIKSLAKAEGLKQKAAWLEHEISTLNKESEAYGMLINELALQFQLRDHLTKEIERLQYSYEPGVLSVEMQKMEAAYQAELAQLNNLRKAYEETKAQFTMDEPAVLFISRATPADAPAHPRKLLYAFIALVLSSTLALFLLLIPRSFR